MSLEDGVLNVGIIKGNSEDMIPVCPMLRNYPETILNKYQIAQIERSIKDNPFPVVDGKIVIMIDGEKLAAAMKKIIVNHQIQTAVNFSRDCGIRIE